MTHRLEAFSDGVFAVAITLLVLDLHDPGTKGGLARGLVELWPHYAAYAVSFLVIGIIWVNHHDTFSRVRTVDRLLQFLNVVLLMTVVLIPFPTTLLSTYLNKGRDSHAAAFAYGLVMTMMGVAFMSLWVHLARHPDLLDGDHDTPYARARARASGIAACVYVAAALVGLLSAVASLALFAAVALYFSLGASLRVSPSRRLPPDDRA